MKHRFAPWKYTKAGVSGLLRISLQEGDAHSNCTRCSVVVKVPKGTSTTKFWVNGAWVTKRPPCKGDSMTNVPLSLPEDLDELATLMRAAIEIGYNVAREEASAFSTCTHGAHAFIDWEKADKRLAQILKKTKP